MFIRCRAQKTLRLCDPFFIKCNVKSFFSNSGCDYGIFHKLCNYRFFYSREAIPVLAKLSPQEVDHVLRSNEYTHEYKSGCSIKSYDSNYLASNNPLEDTRSEGSCLVTSGQFIGVFDGHAGSACAQVVAKRLYDYIAACLLPYEYLQRYLLSLDTDQPLQLIERYNDKVQFVEDVRDIYKTSFRHFVEDIAKEGFQRSIDVPNAIKLGFERLDSDISREALINNSGNYNTKTLSVAMSGCVTCVAHIDGPHLHLAHAGDCTAVLGVLSDTNSWIANKLTNEHNTSNHNEVERILKEHPQNESSTVIKVERLLGQLAPLRAFGDFRYKWSRQILTDIVTKYFGAAAIPPNYYTPPYLTSHPEVNYYRLTPCDKFLVIASDGLWDMVSPLQVIRLVGEHMSGKGTLSPLKLPRKNMKLSDINVMLLQRKEGLKVKPIDRNAATHLIRNVLGGTEYGIDHGKLSQFLSLPDNVSRLFRDDITITVVYFDTEYIRQCPA